MCKLFLYCNGWSRADYAPFSRSLSPIDGLWELLCEVQVLGYKTMLKCSNRSVICSVCFVYLSPLYVGRKVKSKSQIFFKQKNVEGNTRFVCLLGMNSAGSCAYDWISPKSSCWNGPNNMYTHPLLFRLHSAGAHLASCPLLIPCVTVYTAGGPVDMLTRWSIRIVFSPHVLYVTIKQWSSYIKQLHLKCLTNCDWFFL